MTNKFPQFGGGDQHDSHELLRHLLEAVRLVYVKICSIFSFSLKFLHKIIEYFFLSNIYNIFFDRSEDIRRYQAVILKHLNLTKISNMDAVEADSKLKTKFYGNQVSEGIMRAEQVFRGSLVSTVTCQVIFSVILILIFL